MQIIKIFTTFILSLFLLISPVLAEVTTKGIGTIQMQSDDPTNIETEEAKNKAIKSAWKSFVSKFNASKMKQYNLVKEDIEHWYPKVRDGGVIAPSGNKTVCKEVTDAVADAKAVTAAAIAPP